VEAPLLFEVCGLTKRFGRTWALRDASLDVRQGEVLCLIGPNGSGKTTLFECIAGLLPADAGAVRFRGAPIRSRREALHYLPDGIAPWPRQPVRAVLDFFCGLHGVGKARREQMVEALRLQETLRERMGALSKGQRKRVLLALGLLAPRPLRLFDEPFDGLDLRQTREMMAVLRAEAGAGATLLLSIHQLEDAARVCDRLVLLSAGKVAAQGTLAELRARAGLSQGGVEEIFLALA
jgi:ABC-type multidrug transport system ATPase subunit